MIDSSVTNIEQNGITPASASYLGGSIIFTTGASAAGAFINGATLGELYNFTGPFRNTPSNTNASQGLASELGNASGKTVNGSVKIPSTWLSRPSRSGGGIRYYNPENPVEEIRLMPGNPDSPWLDSRKPYMRIRTQSGFVDANGTVSSDPVATHIPITSIE